MHGRDMQPPTDAVAIIGMAARLPGAADVDAYWRNLLDGVCAIRRSDDAALRAAGFGTADLPDPALVRAFGVLDDVACFDARFFGFPPARAAALDPQQRLLLEVAWHAMEHAGYAPGATRGAVGTYLSIAPALYRPQEGDDVADGFFALTARDKDYAASRIAYKLDLTGPSLMIQAASSGSLAAVHAAIEGLLSGQCDMALAGGCSIALPQGAYRHAPGLMLSPTGVCRAFDADADGTVPGSGAGIVVLKPLAAALADGDCIHAVIRGSALNNDGADKSDYLAPSVRGQARVIGEALAVAGVAPDEIGYVETHGTATAIGDPIEIRALARAFEGAAPGRCALGAVKPSIGHLHVASGIAGLIKAALAVREGTIPPTLNYTRANEAIDFAATPFHVADRAQPWPIPGPRRAGVSAFGLGGTNVHVVLEEAPAPAPRAPDTAPAPLILSARDDGALGRMAAALAAHLRAHPALPVPDAAWTLAVGRQSFARRRVVWCADRATAIAALEQGGDGGLQSAADPLADAARRWRDGEAVDWAPLYATRGARRVPLPLYPFERTRHWSHAAAAPDAAAPTQTPAPRAGDGDGGTLLTWLQGVVARRVGLDAGTLDPDATYEAFGIDSLLVNSIAGDLAASFPALKPAALFQHTTLRRLAAHLAASDPAAAARVAPAVAPAVALPAPAAGTPADDGIAIIGMAGRYPGAPDIATFWENLLAGRDAIGEIPADRWDWRAHVADGRRDRSYTRWGGFITDADCFDPLFFGISPREACLLDPQQRVFIETAWAAIEDAGYTRAALKAAAASSGAGDVGVFAGAMHASYRLLGSDAMAAGHLVQANHWSIANRVSFLFDFTGPSLAVDTACSSSLMAVHLACESLRRGECGAAIAGGVNLILHPQQPLELSRAGMLSRGPRNATFAAGADGFVHAEGVGAVLLKPLAAARRDGDRIVAVIRGSAAGAGGRTAGYTVPNPNQQAAVVRAALTRAGIDAGRIGYVECHGTGTALGDPIEVAGLADAFGGAARAAPCALGSVKTNIGHLEAAAGIAGLTKAALQLAHATLVPSLHAQPVNPGIDFDAGPFRVQETRMPWPDAPGGRCAGISSFGAGGANVHVVLEEAPAETRAAASPGAGPVVIALSARTPERLAASAARLRAHLETHPADLADVAWTLATGREAMAVRAAFVAHDMADALRGLAAIADASPPEVPGNAPSSETVARMVAAHDLAGLADAYAAGASVPWAAVFDARRRRVPLPTYPFLRERHWLPETAAAVATGGGILGETVPSLAAEARWPVAPGAAAPVLAAHVVEGRPTLPGVASISLAVAAAARVGRTLPLRITDLAWLRRLEAAPGGPVADIVLREGGAALEMTLERDGVVHARARIAAGAEGPSAQATPPLSPRDPASLYAALAARGLAYGAGFRTITRIAAGDGLAVADARAGGIFGDWPLDPGLLDGALQATAALLDDATLLLPFAVEQVDILRAPPADCRIEVRRLDAGEDASLARFDVVIRGMDGQACVAMHGLTGRASVAARDAVPPCYAPVWMPAEADGGIAAPAPRLVVHAGGDRRARDVLGARYPDAQHVDAAACADPQAWRDALDRAGGAHVLLACADAGADTPDRLLLLLQAMIDRGGAPALTLLAPGALAVQPGERPLPWAAACFGMARVAAHEWPDWSVRCLDPGDWDTAGRALGDAGDRRGREVAWRAGRRLVRALCPATPAPAGRAFRPGGLYVILGGAGGIGGALAAHIVARHGARVALIGRHAPATLPEGISFHAADANDAAALRRAIGAIRAGHGRIDGAIHSAIVMQDQALARMTPATLHAALDVKTLGTMNLVAALAEGGEAPDWLALFSSANSFAANAGQANYVAGCAFKDAYAAIAAARLGCPVRVVNWGFWSEVGRVADEAYRTRLARRGVQGITTAEGLAAIDALLAAEAPQMLVLKADPPVRDALGVTDTQADAPGGAALAAYDALDALTRQSVAQWARRHGGAPLDPARLRVAPRHRRVFDALCDMLARAPADTRPDEAAFVAAHPDLAPHAALLRTCVAAYDEVLSGTVAATSVMFPGASMALVEGIYRGNALTDLCNAWVADAVAEAARRRPAGIVRVLEVGAGTGGTTDAVLTALAATGRELAYHYTDVSPAFAQHGERRFAARHPGLRTGLLDLARDPLDQGYEPASFDVVLGANCVHVTRDLVQTTARLRGLLRPGGALVLYEMTALPDYATATFGLLDGWWAATDARLPHAPLLDAPGWDRVLRAAGYAAVAMRGLGGATPDAWRHSVITATAPDAPADRAAPSDVAERDAPDARAADDLHDAVADVVAATLQMRRADLLHDRNFAEYGADSIISVDLVAALGARFGVALKPTILFSHPTVERLAAHLRTLRPAAPPAAALSAQERRSRRTARHAAATAKGTAPAAASGAGAAPRRSVWADDIAIVGAAGRLPGAADLDAFWDNIAAGVQSVGAVPQDRWDHAAIYDPRPGVAGRTDCPAGGFLDDVASFDPLLFGLSPNEATLMDPQQRLFLMAAWHALEDAGYGGAHPAHARCGVFVGAVAGDYDDRLRAAGHGPAAQTFMGNAVSMLAARIAYRLDLRGPCLSVDTACSSSLTAMQLACESLLRGESDMAVAGGVAVMTRPDFYVAAAGAGMLSPTGRCHTLDAAADGFVPAEGVGAVVLKRRADAVRDGDRILALIIGAASNQDGASNGITAPNGAAQTALLREVQQRFGIPPATLGYVELHGTGTRLGDPIEMEALRAAMAGSASRRRCPVGSVKANIGHALAAAGIAGVLKLVMMLRHRTIPPAAGFAAPNALLDLEAGPFEVPRAMRPWDSDGPRRAGVSGFGFSGTNVHLVLEEAAPPAPVASAIGGPHVVVLSAQTEAALARQRARLAAWLDGAGRAASLADIAGTLARGRAALRLRAAFVVDDLDGLRRALRSPTDAAPDDERAAAWLAGETVAWDARYPDGAFRRIALPLYPFEQRRCWPQEATGADVAERAESLFDAVVDALMTEAAQ